NRRLQGRSLGPPAHRRDFVRRRFRADQGALPRRLPARGSARMNTKRLDAFLPLIGVAGLVAIWSAATFLKLVGPVLLPSPASTFDAFWKGMDGGRLGFDFAKTVYRTAMA